MAKKRYSNEILLCLPGAAHTQRNIPLGWSYWPRHGHSAHTHTKKRTTGLVLLGQDAVTALTHTQRNIPVGWTYWPRHGNSPHTHTKKHTTGLVLLGQDAITALTHTKKHTSGLDLLARHGNSAHTHTQRNIPVGWCSLAKTR